ncbi:minor tail protein [Mycobacterium phage Phayeta]|nr:minor tail protein [Mycobacterium phage Phayeta]
MSGWFPSRPEDVDASLRSWFPERQPRPVTSQTGWWALLTLDAKLSVEYVSTAELDILRSMGVVASVSLTREVALQKLGMLAVARTLSVSGAATLGKLQSFDLETVLELASAVTVGRVANLDIARSEALEAAVALEKVLPLAIAQTATAERAVDLERVGTLEVTRLFQTYREVELVKTGGRGRCHAGRAGQHGGAAAPTEHPPGVGVCCGHVSGYGFPAAHAGDSELHDGWGVHVHLSAQRDLLRPDHARRRWRREGHGPGRRVGVWRQRWQLCLRHRAARCGLRVVGDLVHRHGRCWWPGRHRVDWQRRPWRDRRVHHIVGVRRYDADRCGRRGRHHREPRERRRKVAGRPDTGRVDRDRWCSGGVRQRQRSWRRRGRCHRVDHAWRYRRAWRGGVSRIPVVTPK